MALNLSCAIGGVDPVTKTDGPPIHLDLAIDEIKLRPAVRDQSKPPRDFKPMLASPPTIRSCRPTG